MLDKSHCFSKQTHPAIDLSKWQKTVDLMAGLYNSASGCIVQLRDQEFNVVATSNSEGNFLERDSHWPLSGDTFCRRIIETDTYLYSGNSVDDDEWCEAEHVKKGPVRSYLGFPLHWPDKEIFGTLCVIDTKTSDYSDNMVELLGQLAQLIEADLKHMNDLEEAKALAITDELTGIYNRRGFLTLAPQALKSAFRSKTNSALIYLDIDNLKQINDNFGHQQGDKLIASLGMIFDAQCRSSDLYARLGGDEFVIYLQGVTQQVIESVVLRIDQAFQEALSESILPIAKLKHSEFGCFGISIGYKIFEANDKSDIESRLSKADALMYANKALKKSAAHTSSKSA
jgi:diguanylate cyclase (GGDEF)-like protein